MTENGEDIDTEKYNVCVGVRLRPFNSSELKKLKNSKSIIDVNGNNLILRSHNNEKENNKNKYQKCMPMKREFAYDYCFNSIDSSSTDYTSQLKIFETIGSTLVQNTFEGFNSCILAYGQTGSGKTYTMTGKLEKSNKENDYLEETEVGLIPRIAASLFKRINDIESTSTNTTFKVEASYYEIYNEKAFDLLNPSHSKTRLRVREDQVLGAYIDGLSSLAVASGTDLQRLIDEGGKSRTVAATNFNSESSRSHAVFCIRLTQILQKEEVTREKVSKINLVDLAGSERVTKTLATGDRLQEGGSINNLTTLGQVITCLTERKKKNTYIPYRNSVLTYLLKDCLGGNSKTIMLATCSPSLEQYAETLSTLRFASRMKKIVLEVHVNEDRNTKIIRELKEEVGLLRSQLQVAMNHLDQRNIIQSKEKDLKRAEKLMEGMIKPWHERLEESENINEQRKELLRRYGLEESSTIDCEKIDKIEKVNEENDDYPILLKLHENVNDENIKFIFYLSDRVTTIGSGDECNLKFSGTGIEEKHCSIEWQMTSDGELKDIFLRPFPNEQNEQKNSCDLYVNGLQVKRMIEVQNCDRLLIGKNSYFEFRRKHKTFNFDAWRVNDCYGTFLHATKEILQMETGMNFIQPVNDKFTELNLVYQNRMKELIEHQNEIHRRKICKILEGENNVNDIDSLSSTSSEEKMIDPNEKEERDDSIREGNEIKRITNEIPIDIKFNENFNFDEENQNEMDEEENENIEFQEQLNESMIKANMLVREASFIAKELHRYISFNICFQIPLERLTNPIHQFGSSFKSFEAAIRVSNSNNEVVWTMKKFLDRTFEMRDIYDEWKSQETEKISPELFSSNDPFFVEVTNHELIGVANLFLEALFQPNCYVHYNLPIINQQSEFVGRLEVKLIILNENVCLPSDHFASIYDEENYDESLSNKNVGFSIRIEVIEASGLPLSLMNFVYCEYQLYDRDPTHLSDESLSDMKQLLKWQSFPGEKYQTTSVQFNYENTIFIPITEEFVEHCSNGGTLSFMLYGHQKEADHLHPLNFISKLNETENAASYNSNEMVNSSPTHLQKTIPSITPSVNHLTLDNDLIFDQLTRVRLKAAWNEVKILMELFVEIQEVNSSGVFVPVKISQPTSSGGIYELDGGKRDRRILVRLNTSEETDGGILPLLFESIGSISIGSIQRIDENELKLYDSYQNKDLDELRNCWVNSINERMKQIDQLIQATYSNEDFMEEKKNHELIIQRNALIIEKELATDPDWNSGIPGAIHPEFIEQHIPSTFEKHRSLIFMDLDPKTQVGCRIKNENFMDNDLPEFGKESYLLNENLSDIFLQLPVISEDNENMEMKVHWNTLSYEQLYHKQMSLWEEHNSIDSKIEYSSYNLPISIRNFGVFNDPSYYEENNSSMKKKEYISFILKMNTNILSPTNSIIIFRKRIVCRLRFPEIKRTSLLSSASTLLPRRNLMNSINHKKIENNESLTNRFLKKFDLSLRNINLNVNVGKRSNENSDQATTNYQTGTGVVYEVVSSLPYALIVKELQIIKLENERIFNHDSSGEDTDFPQQISVSNILVNERNSLNNFLQHDRLRQEVSNVRKLNSATVKRLISNENLSSSIIPSSSIKDKYNGLAASKVLGSMKNLYAATNLSSTKSVPNLLDGIIQKQMTNSELIRRPQTFKINNRMTTSTINSHHLATFEEETITSKISDKLQNWKSSFPSSKNQVAGIEIQEHKECSSSTTTITPNDNMDLKKNDKTEKNEIDSKNKSNFSIGDIVIVNTTSVPNQRGIIKFMGKVQFANGIWYGVVLDLPLGKNDGMIKNIRYFSTEQNRGVFVRNDKMTLLSC
ncbi:hypothetical protein SNEBB_010785 [Seison nebaliae]|nr:hypothetical protein SNEBB_010785 [Seison nebaliae]